MKLTSDCQFVGDTITFHLLQMPSLPFKPKPAKAKVKLPTSKAPKNKKAKLASNRKPVPDKKPAKKAPKTVTFMPGDDLLDLIPFKPTINKTKRKPLSLYMRHKEIVYGIIDKVKGDSNLKKHTLKALRTAFHWTRNDDDITIRAQGVNVRRRIGLWDDIFYFIRLTNPPHPVVKLHHKRKQPAIFL